MVHPKNSASSSSEIFNTAGKVTDAKWYGLPLVTVASMVGLSLRMSPKEAKKFCFLSVTSLNGRVVLKILPLSHLNLEIV